jgi:hypothetical protein
LPYNLEITEAAGLIGHRDAIEDPVFKGQLETMRQALQKTNTAKVSGIHWLT